MKRKEQKENEPALAHWKEGVPPASLTTKSGRHRFVVTVKLPERALKTVTQFVADVNQALAKSAGATPAVQFVLFDSDRARLQRAAVEFATFKEARACLDLLKQLGLGVNDVSPELEDFGTKQYDPWHEQISKAWWPWLAKWRSPAPEMPLMKAKNRLDLGAGSKYEVGADGKLSKSEAGRRDRDAEERPECEPEPADPTPPPDEERPKKRRKKKKAETEGGEA